MCLFFLFLFLRKYFYLVVHSAEVPRDWFIVSFPLLSGEYASETYSGGSARRGRARAVPPLCTE